jgi:hypothetical protein
MVARIFGRGYVCGDKHEPPAKQAPAQHPRVTPGERNQRPFSQASTGRAATASQLPITVRKGGRRGDGDAARFPSPTSVVASFPAPKVPALHSTFKCSTTSTLFSSTRYFLVCHSEVVQRSFGAVESFGVLTALRRAGQSWTRMLEFESKS